MGALKAVCCAAAMVACLAPGARADEWNKKTFLTFSGPVQIPGTTLTAGTYTFEIANPDSSRHVIRVSSQDGTKTYGLFITIPNDRVEPPEENIVMFAERPAGSPQAIHVWFYPGDRIGEEFVYPRKQAMEIAKAAHKGVLATSDEQLSNMNAARTAKVERVNENAERGAASASTTTAPPRSTGAAPTSTPAPANTARADRMDKSQPSSTVGTAGRGRRLPRTASPLAGFELVASLALVGALGARQLRRRLS